MIHRSVLSRSGTSVGIKMSEKEYPKKKMKVLQKAQRTVAYDQSSNTSDLISRES